MCTGHGNACAPDAQGLLGFICDLQGSTAAMACSHAPWMMPHRKCLIACIAPQADPAAARTIARLGSDDMTSVLHDSSLTSTQRAAALGEKKQQLLERLGKAGMLRFAVCRIP